MSEEKKRRSRMRILHDEREHLFRGVCDNCKKEKDNVRRLESIGFSRESRGFFNICLDCVGPTVKWENLDTNQTWTSPAFNYAEEEKE